MSGDIKILGVRCRVRREKSVVAVRRNDRDLSLVSIDKEMRRKHSTLGFKHPEWEEYMEKLEAEAITQARMFLKKRRRK